MPDSDAPSGDDSDAPDSGAGDSDAADSDGGAGDGDASGDDSDGDDSDSDFAPEKPKAKGKRAAKVYERPLVELRSADRVHSEAAKRGVPAGALARAIKAFMLVASGDTEGERANAERALGVLLRTHALERADVATLAKPVADAELLEQGAEVRCFGNGLKATPWTCSLARACKLLFGTDYYTQGGMEFVFYGETAGSMSTAQLFAELYPTVLQLTDEYMAGAYARRRDAGDAPTPLSARASYRHGLCEGFANLARDVATQRAAYITRVVAETEFRRKAVADRAAELAEKQRIQRLAALQVVNETLASSAAAPAAADGASGSGAGASTGAGAGASGAADEAANACAICWEPMTKGVAFITNPCGHAFHVACQATAVAARLTSCGLCRAPLTLTVFPSAPPPAAAAGGAAGDGSDDEEEESDDDGAEVSDDGSGGAGGGAAGMSDDDDVVVCTGEYTAEEAIAARRAASEVVDLTAEDLQALAQEVHKKHSDALTLALVAKREAAVVKALNEKIFGASCRRKDGTLKAKYMRKSKRVARDADAYGAGKQDAKRLKMGNTLEG